MASNTPKLVFLAEWQEPYAPVPRKFVLTYHIQDGSVEMFDVKSRRMFLRRTPCSNLEKADFYVGNKVNVLSRLLTLTDYGDAATKQVVGCQMERILALLKADGISKLGDLLSVAQENDIEIRNMKMFCLTTKQDQAIQRKLLTPSAFEIFISSGKLIAFEMKGVGLEKKWNDIRSQLNIVEISYGSNGKESSENEIKLVFEKGLGENSIKCNTAIFRDSTCCIVKPHAIREGKLSEIIQRILNEGFSITALEMMHLNTDTAEEFFEVYRGIIPGYQRLLEEMTSGLSVVMEVSGPEAYKKFRDLVGPRDPEMARILRPHTIRAHFGKDKIQNAVHCPDLPEDASLEVEYFFKIMSA